MVPMLPQASITGLCVSASLKCCLHYAHLITSGSVQTSEKLRGKSDAENELQFFRQPREGYFLGTSQVEKLSSPASFHSQCNAEGLLILT